jgi:hypothetical protein
MSAPNGKIMIGLYQVPISKTFGINNAQWGLSNSAALITASLFYPSSRTWDFDSCELACAASFRAVFKRHDISAAIRLGAPTIDGNT